MTLQKQTIEPASKNNLQSMIPIMEKPQMAFYLAIIAGLMNGYTYHTAKLFSTVQSGNIILLGETIATKNWSHFYNILLTVLAFGVGSMFTAFIEYVSQKQGRKNWTLAVIFLEALILLILASGLLADYFSITSVCITISFIAGMQGNGFHKIKGMLYGNVAVTLVVQLGFSYLMQALQGSKGSFQKALLFFIVLLGFGMGGFLGTLATIQYAELALLLPAILLILLLGYLCFIQSDDDDVIDPN